MEGFFLWLASVNLCWNLIPDIIADIQNKHCSEVNIASQYQFGCLPHSPLSLDQVLTANAPTLPATRGHTVFLGGYIYVYFLVYHIYFGYIFIYFLDILPINRDAIYTHLQGMLLTIKDEWTCDKCGLMIVEETQCIHYLVISTEK